MAFRIDQISDTVEHGLREDGSLDSRFVRVPGVADLSSEDFPQAYGSL